MPAGEDRRVAGEILDYVLYAPVGLLVTVAEEMPVFVAKGRARLATARTIGEFAVAIGRKRAEKTVSDLLHPSPGEPSAGEGQEARSSGEAAAGEASTAADGEHAGAADVAATASGPMQSGSGESRQSAGAAATPAKLAIPGYDSLAASQVVQRLAGLSSDELEEVRRYEEATRARRTILGRISQLSSTRGTPETV